MRRLYIVRVSISHIFLKAYMNCSENTLHKLFAAQSQLLNQDPIPVPSEIPVTKLQRSASAPQASLHAFWGKLPTRAGPSNYKPNTSNSLLERTDEKCEDCDHLLSTGDNGSMDIDMDLEMAGAGASGEKGCGSCGRIVCEGCAVIGSIGDSRVCLQCATSQKKTWIGGLGWM
jgi:hypothetical protein